jgi:predicted RNA-binding Zn-ribbon protein involved in translation (DUF1610 family)
MPFGAPKCPKCGKAVYHAEKQVVLGKDWHKTCVKCDSCGKKLEPGNLSDNEGKIYCKPCHAKQTGISGYGFGGAGGALASYQSYGSGESTLVGGDQVVEAVGGEFVPVQQSHPSAAAPAAGGHHFCTECGQKADKSAKFCPQCGNRFEE